MAEFVNGMRVFKPRDTAPEFIKANLVVNVAELIPWLETNANGTGEVRIDIKESKKGSWYAEKNTYSKENKQAELPTIEYPKDEITSSDLPF